MHPSEIKNPSLQVLSPERDRGDFHVVFIRAPILSTDRSINNEATPPLAFALLAGYLTGKGYRCTVIDAIGLGLNRRWKWPHKDHYVCQGATFAEILDGIPPDADLFAFSCMFSGEWPMNRTLIQKVRELYPAVPTLAGGEHASALSEYSLRDCPELDFVISGEGEYVLFQFADALRRATDLSTVPGVKFLDREQRYVDTGSFPRVQEIDEIPWPHWDLIPLENYWIANKSYGITTYRDMPFMVSRGCPYRCTFCSNPQMWTTRYTLRNVDNVLEEIDFYIKKYGITSLQFYDLTAITKKSWVLEFCNKMIERGIDIKWSLPSGTRSEVLDEEVLSMLAKTHCNYLVYAPESGSPETLKIIKKRIELKRFTKSIREAKRQGLVLRTNLILGFPHETRRHMFETIRYGLRLAFMGVEEVSINIFSPYPGSEIFKNLMASRQLEINDEYFYMLTSLNSDYTRVNPLTFCKKIGPRELAFYRIFFMLLNYLISYLFFPKRIVRSMKNIFQHDSASTVFEHRMQDLLKRKTETPR